MRTNGVNRSGSLSVGIRNSRLVDCIQFQDGSSDIDIGMLRSPWRNRVFLRAGVCIVDSAASENNCVLPMKKQSCTTHRH
jgi:hypothetical protein